MVVRLLLLLLCLQAEPLVAGPSTTQGATTGASSLSASPSSFDIRDDQARVHRTSITIQNPNGVPVAAQVSLRHPRSRRLSDGIIVVQGDEEALGAGRRLQAAPNCSQPLLLLRPRAQQSVRATRRLRRLAQLPGLENSTWLYLSHLGLSIAQLDCTTNAEELAKQLEKEHAGDLEFVEVDQRNLFKLGISEPQWSRQWGMRRSGFDRAWSRLEAYDFAAAPVIVAVLDTGVELSHEDLQGRLWQNPGEIPGNGLDDDGNGFVDDVHGWDFADGDADPTDHDGHGTHCAGVIGAAENGRGVVGASGAVQIMALRFLSSEGGRTSDAILALNYAVSMGAEISSNSWGGASHSLALESAIQAAREGGHLFVAAAGNLGSGNDFVPTFPCNYEATLCVAATTSGDELADYSNYGVNSVEIAAPGTDIVSTYLGNSYVSLSGTSMATPHVAGAAALVWSWMGRRFVSDVEDLRAIILESAERAVWLSGWVTTGLLDVHAMVLKAESRNWLRLLQPEGGLVDATGTVATVQLAAYESRLAPLEIGHESLAVGNYWAELVVSGAGEDAVLPVSYAILGSPYLPASIFNGMLDFGMVPVGGEGRRTVRLWNYGNGTARAQVSVLTSPFAGPLVEVVVEPHASTDLIITCRPNSAGHFSGSVAFNTNSGLAPFEAATAEATQEGERFNMAMACEGSEAPQLELDAFSGAVLLQADSLPFHFTPSVPAQWEEHIKDPAAAETNITAPLAAAHSSNLQGCLPHEPSVLGHIVLVSRGGCTFQDKVNRIQDMGGVGALFYDSESRTTLRMMGTADVTTPPSLPAFMVSRSQGLALRDRVASGELLMISLVRRPVTLHTHLPGAGAPRAHGRIGLQNMGGGFLSWNTEVNMLMFEDHSYYSVVYRGAPNSTAGPDVASLPAAPAPSWTLSGTLREDEHFRGQDLDDTASPLTLAYPVPFYGQMVEDVQMSSNGLVAMAPDHGTFRPGGDYFGHLPSEALPNGLVAAYWDDLGCRASRGCQLLTGQRTGTEGPACSYGNATIIQFKEFQHRFADSVIVSSEVRLYEDGCIELQYQRFPRPSLRAGAKIGIESRDGQSGLNLAPNLHFHEDEHFGIMMVPFLASRSHGGSLAGGAAADFRFHVEGYRSKQAWITFRASDSTSHWSSERMVRVVQQVFSYSWKASAWGPCTSLDCNSNVGQETRSVHCGGSDGGTYGDEHCAGPPTCTDVPGWLDSYGDSCHKYAANLYCLETGGYGPGWKWFWGSFEDYRNHGHVAPTACCACGGGTLADSRPAASRSCSAVVQGPDWDGDGLDDCAPALAPPAPVTETTTRSSRTTTSSSHTATTATTRTTSATSRTSSSSTSSTATWSSQTTTSSTASRTSSSTWTVSSTSSSRSATSTATTTSSSRSSSGTSTWSSSTSSRTSTRTSTATTSFTSTSVSGTSTSRSSSTLTWTQTSSSSGTSSSTSRSATGTSTTSSFTWTPTSTSTQTSSGTSTATSTTSSTETLTRSSSSSSRSSTETSSISFTSLTSTESRTSSSTTATSTSSLTTSSSSISITRSSSSATTTSLTGSSSSATMTSTQTESSTRSSSSSTSRSSSSSSSTSSSSLSSTGTSSETSSSSTHSSTSVTKSSTVSSTSWSSSSSSSSVSTSSSRSSSSSSSVSTTSSMSSSSMSSSSTSSSTSETSTSSRSSSTSDTSTRSVTSSSSSSSSSSVSSTWSSSSSSTSRSSSTSGTSSTTLSSSETWTSSSTRSSTMTSTSSSFSSSATSSSSVSSSSTSSSSSSSRSSTSSSSASSTTTSSSSSTGSKTDTSSTTGTSTSSISSTSSSSSTSVSLTSSSSLSSSTTTSSSSSESTSKSSTTTSTSKSSTRTSTSLTSSSSSSSSSSITSTSSLTSSSSVTSSSSSSSSTVSETSSSSSSSSSTSSSITWSSSSVTSSRSTTSSVTSTSLSSSSSRTSTTSRSSSSSSTTSTSSVTSSSTTASSSSLTSSTETTTGTSSTTGSSTSVTGTATSSTTGSSTSQTSTSSETSSSRSSTSSSLSSSSTWSSSSATATGTSSATRTTSTASRTTATVTGTSTVTTSSGTVTATTATWTTATATSTTRTRNSPPVQVMSEPEEVRTIDSTLLVLGANDSMPNLDATLQDSISGTIGVDPRRVAIGDLGMTMAAVVDDLGRRLSFMELALEVKFQVILPGATSFQSPELGGFSTAEGILEAVSAMKEDPAELITKLSESLATEMPLRARLTTPTLQQKQAVVVAEQWGACGAGLACAGPLAMRYRRVWCADAANTSNKLAPGVCSGNVPRTVEPCPAEEPRPPVCGWQLGSWSECRSEAVEVNFFDPLRRTGPCDSTGIGSQERHVACLTQGTGEECEEPRPSSSRQCQCVASAATPAPKEQLEVAPVQAAGGGTVLMGVMVVGCVLFTFITFSCISMGCRKADGKVKAAKEAHFDGCKDSAVVRADTPPDAQTVTVCVAVGRGREVSQEAAPDMIEPPSPATSYRSRVAPLSSPSSVASVASQPRLPLASPSAMSVSSIALQSPAHSQAHGADGEPPNALFAALNSPSNIHVRPPTSPKKRTAPSLPCVVETEQRTEVREPRARRKAPPRPPTLELDRYVNGSDDDVEMHFATPTASRSPSKRRDFGPAWLREDGGTPAQVERFELPPQPQLPQPPPATPGGTQLPPPIPKDPAPPAEAPRGLRRGGSKVNFPSVPPSPSSRATSREDLTLPAAPNLPPPPRSEAQAEPGV